MPDRPLGSPISISAKNMRNILAAMEPYSIWGVNVVRLIER
jgi:hypothetical protein